MPLPLFYFLVFKQSDCRENLYWDWAEKAQAHLMPKDIAVKICWYSRGALQNSDDQHIFLLFHFIHKCNRRSYHSLCLINTQWNAVGQEANCFLSRGGRVVGSHSSQERGGVAPGIIQEPRDMAWPLFSLSTTTVFPAHLGMGSLTKARELKVILR